MRNRDKEEEFQAARTRQIEDARSRAQGLVPAQAHDRDLISAHPEHAIAEKARTRKERVISKYSREF